MTPPGDDGGVPPPPTAPLGSRGGSLLKEAIRRVIRRNINYVKSCYDTQLATRKLLAGLVVTRFVIAPDGRVAGSGIVSSTLGSDAAVRCIALAMRRWEFPKPDGGGFVTVTYPFVLAPAPIVVLPGRAGRADRLSIRPLTSSLLVHTSTDTSAVPANGMIAISARGLTLIDTGWTTAQTEAILQWGERELQRPWIGAVLTHAHPDRAAGLPALLARGIPISASDLTVARLAAQGNRGVMMLVSASARDPVPAPAGFEVLYPGPAHTADNIVIAWPEQGVLFGGCLLKAFEAHDLGNTADADLTRWPEAVKRVAAVYPRPDFIVPGHGQIDTRHTVYQRTLDLIAGESTSAVPDPDLDPEL